MSTAKSQKNTPPIVTVAKRVVGRRISSTEAKTIKVKKPIQKEAKVIKQPKGKGMVAGGERIVKSIAERVEKAIALRTENKPDPDDGRPLFNGKNVEVTLAKLEGAFSVGATDEEACMQADISLDSLYRYERKNPEFRNKKHLLKTKLNLVARATIAQVMQEKDKDNIPTDRALETSQWFLPRSLPAEFGDRKFNANFDFTPNNLPPEREAEIMGAMQAWDSVDDEDWEDSDYEIEKD